MSPERIDPDLKLHWAFSPRHPPQPAWPAPGEETPRMHSDRSFPVVLGQGKVFFGTAADNKVHALDAATGQPQWTFFTEGAVRFAPVLYQGRLYFGADDGLGTAQSGPDLSRSANYPLYRSDSSGSTIPGHNAFIEGQEHFGHEMNIALDTNAYSDFMRGNPARVQVVRTATRIHLPLFVLAELRAGFGAGTQQSTNASSLQRFLNSPRVSVLSPDEATTHHYARIWLQLRQQGVAIPTHDLWIAALALQHGLVLCTSDAHFQHIPQLPRC
jgi:tRNA(fMet)-specific endonuclease VapC